MDQTTIPMVENNLNEYILRQSGGIGSDTVSYTLRVMRTPGLKMQIDSAFSENMMKDYSNDPLQVERLTPIQQRLYHLYLFYGESQTIHF